jgi:DNA-binding SARP family transcriptional activator
MPVSDAQQDAPISLRLFGGPQVTVAGQDVALPTEQVRRVLAVLALAAPQLISRSVLTGWFWPEMEQQRAGRNLAATLSRLRRALPPLPLLLDDGQALGLNPALWQLDSAEVAQLQQQIERHSHRAVDRCLRCLTAAQRLTQLTAEPLLARLRPLADEEPGSWISVERDRCRRLSTSAVLITARAALRAGRFDDAAQLLRRALRQDPWHDALQQLLLQALAGAGGPAAALAAYRQQQRQLRRRFGLAPAAETRALAEALSNRQAVVTLPILPPADDNHGAADLQLADLIAQPETRVVTVIGADAEQRSRLIAATATRLAPTFDGGTLWLPDVADVAALLARLCELTMLPADADLPAVAAALNRRPPLVAVGRLGGAPAQAGLLAALSAACPQLVLLAGREEPCLLWHETVYRLTGTS